MQSVVNTLDQENKLARREPTSGKRIVSILQSGVDVSSHNTNS